MFLFGPKGPFYFSHAVAKQMREQKSGLIINIGSITGAEGDGCLVAAGSVVTGKTVAPAGWLLMGNPAKLVRNLTPEELMASLKNATEYVSLGNKAFGNK